jgi:hypothetical protein
MYTPYGYRVYASCVARQTTYVTALREALSEVDIPSQDTAAVRLAYGYASNLDGGGDIIKVGPLLLSALDALGMTPRARAALVKGTSGGDDSAPPAAPTAIPGALDQIRERRARKSRAEAVDAATS